MGDVVEETAEEPTYYYEVTLEPKPVLRSYMLPRMIFAMN